MHICPKCKEGQITLIRFKKSNIQAYLCDLCEALWFSGENINEQPTHTIHSYLSEKCEEYMIIQDEEKHDHVAIYPYR